MRAWRARPETSAGALFDYVAAGKRSVIGDASSAEVSDLIAAADVIITDLGDGRSLADIASAATESAVVIAITPFGTHGPYVDQDLQVNEFILQALCGSIGGRGWPGSEPMQAGGRLGEWFAGAYAAVVVAASVRAARRTGSGQVIDLSIFESMAIVMGSLGAVSASVLGDVPNARRAISDLYEACAGSPATAIDLLRAP